jgi:uncharacterized protein YoxC
MLAAMSPPVMLLFVVILVAVILLLIIGLKKSKGVDKLNDGLFKPVETNTIDDCIDKIKDGKDGLVQKSKEITKDIADKTKEQLKINKNL